MRSGPAKHSDKVTAKHSNGGVVRIDPAATRALIGSYRRAGGELWERGLRINALVHQAGDLLGQALPGTSLLHVAILLGRDADDLEWRVDYLESTDGFDLAARDATPLAGWPGYEANDVSYHDLALLLVRADSPDELHALLSWMLRRGSDPGSAFERDDVLLDQPRIPTELRTLFAGALVTAYESGWRGEDGELPVWLAAGMAAYGNPSDELLVELAHQAFDNTDIGGAAAPNPFGLERDPGFFGPFAEAFVARPEAGQLFITTLLDEFDRTGNTRLNMHEDNSRRAMQLADIVVASGTWGPIADRERFVDRLVRTINADDDTNGPVFWATWSVHADLVLEHGVVTTAPTFGQHHLVPDAIRPTWEHHWHEHISPFVLNQAFVHGKAAKDMVGMTMSIMDPVGTMVDATTGLLDPTGRYYNDPGGTYTLRRKDNFYGLRFHHSAADQGRHVLLHTLEDSSDRGDIGQDEFAIINHGLGADGRPTFTVNLPGVIDLSNPLAGWDPEHMSVRDMDMAALLSATSARVEDNLYAQMVVRALRVNEIPLGSNLLLVGHSFGADTVADLAAHPEFSRAYNVTHVVAAAYDSVPQLAHIDPSIDVLVLQNDADKAITLEATQRHSSMADNSVSIDTFAHEVRVFDGGMGFDIGHHQDRYITYLLETEDPELTRFYESIAATGYANAGTSVAVDVTLDPSLVNE